MSVARGSRVALLAALLCASVAVARAGAAEDELAKASPGQGPAASGAAVDRYLQRLGLGELRLRNQERSLSRLEGAEKTAAAKKLAEAYVQQLLAAAEDTAKARELERRVRALIEQAPEVNTPELQILLLQADYQLLEASILPWMRRETAERPAADTRTKFAELAARFTAQHRSLLDELEKAAVTLEPKITAAQRAKLEQQASAKQALASRAQFFVGWTNYYVGVLDLDDAESKESLTAAQTAFCDLLAVGPDREYADVEPEGLGLESTWRSRAVIGLGLTECALQRTTAAERCFGWLLHPSVPLALRDQGPYWHLLGLLNAGSVDAAVTLAQTQVDRFSPGESGGRLSFCVLLVRAGFVGEGAFERTTSGPTASRRLGDLGILGLAKLRQFDALSTLMARHSIAAASPVTRFYVTWLDGRRKFTEAEKSKRQDDYLAAREAFTAALAFPEAQSDLAVAGRCQLGLAWCHYRLDDFQQAAKVFQQATPLLRAEAPDDALQSAWMEAVCYYQLVEKQPAIKPQAIAALEAILRDYPKATQAAKAQSLLERLRPELATPEEKAKRLAAIPVGDARFVDAQFELCQLHHGRWLAAKGNKQAVAEAASDVLAAARKFLQATTPDGDYERRLRASLLALEVASAGATVSGADASFFHRSAAAAAEKLPATHRSLPELHYRGLLLAQQAGDVQAVERESAWIVKHAVGTPYELVALMQQALRIDSLVKNGGELPSEKLDELRAAGAQTYGRLATLLGDSPEQLRTNKNALAANSRFAWYLEDQQKWGEAAEQLEKLVAAFPKDRGYLRRAAIAQTKAGNHEVALAHWRKLLTGLKSGSDPWLEAKYFQIECLLATDRAAAVQVWKQFQLLYPTVDSKEWGPRFAELAKRLEMSAKVSKRT